jgi:proline dehydrogenase
MIDTHSIDFNNTEIAFSSKTNFQLKKSYWLFWFFGFPKLMKFGTQLAVWAIQWKLPVEFIIRWSVFNQFCGGQTIDECRPTLAMMKRNKIGAILDYSVEGKETEIFFDQTVHEIIDTLVESKKDQDKIPFSVFKLTGICKFSLLEKINQRKKLTDEETSAWDKAKERVDLICAKAFETQTPILIDAEESWIQDAIDNLVHEMMQKYNKERAIVYNTVQLYRHDRLLFLKNSVAEAKKIGYHYGVKLVRGAYMEKERARALEKKYPSPIQVDKNSTDQDYNAALHFCIECLEKMSICAGSHNEESNLFLVNLMKEKNILSTDKRVYFAQLFGMSDHISYNLAYSGYNVAKYVPYGILREVIPYLVRRAEENTSMGGQMGRELRLLTQEIARRKQIIS